MNQDIINLKNVEFVYKSGEEDGKDVTALSGISAGFTKGQFIVVLGRNGSGKSTLAKLTNALLIPTAGTVIVNGIDTRDERRVWDIRSSTGMVFQNPDNQIVGTSVEEDVAFGPENLGVKPEEIRQRVDEALMTVGMSGYSTSAPHQLSGGQKQRVAIAGILAMKPQCIVLDEATSMLDPVGRKEVMAVLKKLNREENITVILITHHMDEACAADRVIVVDKGQVIMDSTPSGVFSNVEKIKELGLDVPQVTELFHELNREGLEFPGGIIDIESAYTIIKALVERKR